MLTASQIKQRLEHLKPSFIKVNDDSHAHAEHIDNPTGGLTHATIIIVSEEFKSMPHVQRHRLIYNSLSDALASSLHALSIKAFTEEEWNKEDLLNPL